MDFGTLDLNTTWFILIAVLFAGYAVLDGFDLGVGALHLFVKGDNERRILLNTIGPVWDGNEVWLVTGGGALFAAFPNVYATVFSGFYIALVLLLVSLIFRAVAIEFRSKRESKLWRGMWDTSFSLGSVLSGFLLGVAFGNVAVGIPLDARGEFTGSFWTLLRPYPIMVGLTGIALFTMHGSIYALLKTNGTVHEKLRVWAPRAIWFFVVCYALLTIATFVWASHLVERFKSMPWLFCLAIVNLLAIANVVREIRRRRDWAAFLSSCVAVIMLLAICAIGMYPNLVLSAPNPEYSLTIRNAASSQKTLGVMLTIALIGMPLVIGYTSSIYYIFRGKVKLDRASY